MVEFVNMIIRNEDVQGQKEKFKTWKASLDAALFEAENKNISWAEAKRHRVEIWRTIWKRTKWKCWKSCRL